MRVSTNMMCINVKLFTLYRMPTNALILQRLLGNKFSSAGEPCWYISKRRI